TAVDPSDPRKAYTTNNGAVSFTSDGGDTWQFTGGPSIFDKFRFAVDPNNGSIVYATSDSITNGCLRGCFFFPGSQLFRSVDSGVTFQFIQTFPAPIEAIANVATDSNILWVGLTNGTVQRTANALAGAATTWIPLTVTGGPTLSVGAIAINPLHT